ncbi:PaaI family thioesterase [Phenylobacterium sp.]|uniref:PaaI family thioesterase n=1 Tax=Phenylobacterium sp. TaxID=1871053 RepID=UPI002FCA3DB0
MAKPVAVLALLADRALPTFGCMELQPARFDAEARRLSVSAHIGAEFADGRGVVRGGFFAAVLDDVMTGAVILTLGDEVQPRLVTQSLDYLCGAGPGEFTAEGWVVSVGPDYCLTRAELRGPGSELAALAQGVVVRNTGDG